MAQDPKDRDLPVRRGDTPLTIPLGPSASLDLSFLPESERQALLIEYTRGVLDINRKAQELHLDVGVLKNTLNTLAESTQQVAQTGNAVTVAHTQETSIGRTEILMGNTEAAKGGKLSRSQTGEKDWTPYYIVAGIIAAVLVALILRR